MAAEAFKEIVGKAPILAGSVGQLVAGEVIHTIGNKHTLVDMERRRNWLCKQVDSVVVSVSAVV